MNRTINTTDVPGHVRVALIIQGGKLTPKWFDIQDKPSFERVTVREVCSRWSHKEGAAKILNFSVTDGSNTYRLSLNTLEFTWTLAVTIPI